MCGIAGIICLDGVSRKIVKSLHFMGKCMHKRGPDDEGYLIASHQSKQVHIFKGDSTPATLFSINFYPSKHITTAYDMTGSVFLAHRRLAIIDISSFAHQPMCSKDKRFWIVFNGEIYNYKEIKNELEHKGVTFISNSDTEVLLYAYITWGINVFERLNGMFAFVIWDNLEKTLFCARDRVGIKPFYYTIQNNQFIFASDIRTIICSGLYIPEVNIEGLYYAMSFGVAPRPLTSFKKIYALEQGHWLIISRNGEIKKGCYWKPPTGQQDINMKESEAIELLESSLKNSIKLRLVADVSVGTFMSGGIDSTTVSAIASKFHPGIKAFTLVFSRFKSLDESRQAKATAGMHSMEHIVQDVEIDSVLNHIEEMVECYEEPFYDLSPNYMISKFVAENNVTVVLNGLGGDELFGGYPYFRWLGRWKFLQKLKLLFYIGEKIPGIRHISQRLYEIASTQTADCFATAVRCFFTDREKYNLFLDPKVKEYRTIEKIHDLYVGKDREFSDHIEAISYIDLINYIGNHHVYRVDKFTMHFSIEGRLPFLDHNLIELAFKIPSYYKLTPREQKYVLRKVAERHIHPLCLKTPKKGFDFPTDSWMRTKLKKFVVQKLQALSKRELFNPKIIWQTYWEWFLKFRSFRSVWQLVSIQMWMEKFIDAQWREVCTKDIR